MTHEYTARVPEVRASEVPEPGAVTIVVPTFNESANVRELLHQITESVPARLPCEVVFVDDLPKNAAGKILRTEARTIAAHAAVS